VCVGVCRGVHCSVAQSVAVCCGNESMLQFTAVVSVVCVGV